MMDKPYSYRGYEIVRALHPTRLSPTRTTWDVLSDGKVRYSNIGSIETAKHLIDAMVKWGYWPEKGGIG